MLDQKGQEIEKLIAVVSNDQVNMKKGLDDKVEAIERNLEINEKSMEYDREMINGKINEINKSFADKIQT